MSGPGRTGRPAKGGRRARGVITIRRAGGLFEVSVLGWLQLAATPNYFDDRGAAVVFAHRLAAATGFNQLMYLGAPRG